MNKVEEIEGKLNMLFEFFLKAIDEENDKIASMTMFFDSSYKTYSIFPYEGETKEEFSERVIGLEKDIYPVIILGCDPLKNKLYDGVIMLVHTETNIDKCFYHKKNYRLYEGWIESFD